MTQSLLQKILCTPLPWLNKTSESETDSSPTNKNSYEITTDESSDETPEGNLLDQLEYLLINFPEKWLPNRYSDSYEFSDYDNNIYIYITAFETKFVFFKPEDLTIKRNSTNKQKFDQVRLQFKILNDNMQKQINTFITEYMKGEYQYILPFDSNNESSSRVSVDIAKDFYFWSVSLNADNFNNDFYVSVNQSRAYFKDKDDLILAKLYCQNGDNEK